MVGGLKLFARTPPPQKSMKFFYNEFSLPTFGEGTGSFVSGGPYGPGVNPPPPSKIAKTL